MTNGDACSRSGFPGFLSKKELRVLEDFRHEIERRDDAFRSAVFSFEAAGEDETYALCRWLRARKFELCGVIEMVEQAVEVRKVAAANDFFKDPRQALRVEPSIFLAQYPQLYSGYSRSGYPVFISKPGMLNITKLECITTLDGVLRYHWHCMMHQFVKLLRVRKEYDADFQRFECVCIMDLSNLAYSQVGKGYIDIFKANLQMDSLCFPETLNKLIIVNAPSFFPMTWKVIRSMIDQRTSSKVEIFSSRQRWKKRLLELIEPAQLPSDYGGEAVSIATKMLTHEKKDETLREWTALVTLRSFSVRTEIFELLENEVIELKVFTRSNASAAFSVQSLSHPQSNVLSEASLNQRETFGHEDALSCVTFRNSTSEDHPFSSEFTRLVEGPGVFEIDARCNGYSLSPGSFLIVGMVKTKESGNRERAPIEEMVVENQKLAHMALSSNPKMEQVIVDVAPTKEEEQTAAEIAPSSFTKSMDQAVVHITPSSLTKSMDQAIAYWTPSSLTRSMDQVIAEVVPSSFTKSMDQAMGYLEPSSLTKSMDQAMEMKSIDKVPLAKPSYPSKSMDREDPLVPVTGTELLEESKNILNESESEENETISVHTGISDFSDLPRGDTNFQSVPSIEDANVSHSVATIIRVSCVSPQLKPQNFCCPCASWC